MILKTKGDTPYIALYKTLEDLKNSGMSTWDIGMFLECATLYFESPTAFGRPQLIEII
jgi:hypothetical protein